MINRPGSRQGVEPLGRRVCERGGVPDGGQRQRPQSPPALILVPESKQVDSVCLSLSELRLFLGLRGKLLSKGKRPGPVLGTQRAAGHPKVRQGRGGLGLGSQGTYRAGK